MDVQPTVPPSDLDTVQAGTEESGHLVSKSLDDEPFLYQQATVQQECMTDLELPLSDLESQQEGRHNNIILARY